MDLIIPSTACLEALYIAPPGIARQDANKKKKILRPIRNIKGGTLPIEPMNIRDFRSPGCLFTSR